VLGKSGFRWLNLKTAVETIKREAGLLGNTLQIRVHLCSSVVELLFLGLAAASM